LQPQGLDVVLRSWEADAVCGELFRYVRDAAYAYSAGRRQGSDKPSAQTAAAKQEALRYLDMAARLERVFDPAQSANRRYHAMRDIAYRHAARCRSRSRQQPRAEPQHGLQQPSRRSNITDNLHNLRAWRRRRRNG
jgi:hypothetical protein